MKRILLFLTTIFLGIALFGFLVSGVGWQEIVQSLRSFSFGHAFWIFLLTGAFLAVGMLRWQSILQSQNVQTSLRTLWGMYLAGFSFSFLIPVIPFANEVFRASTLKQKYDLSFNTGMASVIIDRILEVSSNLLVVVAAALILLFLGESAHYAVQVGAIVVFVAIWFVLLFLVYVRIFQKKSIIRLFWHNGERVEAIEEEVFGFFHVRNPAFWEGMLFSLFRSFIGLVRAWVLIFFLGKGFVPLAGVAVLGLYYLGIIVPIPASLGPHDALQIIGFGAFGMGAGAGAAFALVTRAVELVFAAAGVCMVFRFGWSMVRAFRLRNV